MINRTLYLQDKLNARDNLITDNRPKTLLHGEVFFKNELGEVLFRKKNIILVPGRRFVLEKIFNVGPETSNRITLNSLFHVNESEPPYPGGTGPRREKSICLFGVGRGGSDLTFGSVINPASREYNLYDMVPFRYVPTSSDLDDITKAKYALKVTEGSYYAYYLKHFETDPVLYMKADGVDYVVSLDDNTRIDEHGEYIDRPDVEVYVDLELKITTEDIREFFIATETIDNARINELALYYAYKEDLGVWSDYYAIECFSKITFNNISFVELNKQMDIVYRIYI